MMKANNRHYRVYPFEQYAVHLAGNLQKLMVTTPLFYANGSPHIGAKPEKWGPTAPFLQRSIKVWGFQEVARICMDLPGSGIFMMYFLNVEEARTLRLRRMLWRGMGSCEKQKFTMWLAWMNMARRLREQRLPCRKGTFMGRHGMFNKDYIIKYLVKMF